MKGKKFSIILLVVSIMLFQTESIFAQTTNIIINGNKVNFTQQTGTPYVDKNSRTMVPLRITMESAGFAVGYDMQKQVAIVISEHDRVEVPINNDFIYNNNQKIQNDTSAVVNNKRTYLPIRVVLESMGYTVEWDSKTQTVNAYNFTPSNDLVPYSTSSLKTLTQAVLSGNVIYLNGNYYATPQYVKLLQNTQIHYSGDDLNKSIYPEENNRYDFAEVELEWVTVNNFEKIMVNKNELNFDTSKLEKGYIDNYVYVYAFYENGLTNQKIVYALPDLTDEFMNKDNETGTFNGILIKRENGETYFNVKDLENKGIQ